MTKRKIFMYVQRLLKINMNLYQGLLNKNVTLHCYIKVINVYDNVYFVNHYMYVVCKSLWCNLLFKKYIYSRGLYVFYILFSALFYICFHLHEKILLLALMVFWYCLLIITLKKSIIS